MEVGAVEHISSTPSHLPGQRSRVAGQRFPPSGTQLFAGYRGGPVYQRGRVAVPWPADGLLLHPFHRRGATLAQRQHSYNRRSHRQAVRGDPRKRDSVGIASAPSLFRPSSAWPTPYSGLTATAPTTRLCGEKCWTRSDSEISIGCTGGGKKTCGRTLIAALTMSADTVIRRLQAAGAITAKLSLQPAFFVDGLNGCRL